MGGRKEVKNQHGGGDSTLSQSHDPEQSRSLSQILLAPWPEWTDSEINAEKWDMGYGPSTNPADILKGSSIPSVKEISFENLLERRSLPGSLQGQVLEWKRALSVNPRFQVLPVYPEATDLDLVSSNGHILHSELIKHIVTSIMNLHHLAAMKPFQEASSDNFIPNGGPIWKPWNHVYSKCKVGKGTSHKPSVNKFGKYVVRVHFLGQWRRITVDDYLPLDEFGRILLPTTTRDELWPILLAKAITLIASLTCTPTSEVLEMNAVTCFTGWFALKVECQRVPVKDLWHVCQKALMHDAEDGARYKEEPKTTDAYQLGLAMAGGDRKDPLTYAMSNDMEEGWGSVAVFADMTDIEEDPDEEVGEIGPCVGHQVLFSEARIIRIGDDGGELPLWKTFRWKKWALQKGIIQQEHLANVKSLRLFAPLKKWMPPAPTTASTLFSENIQMEEAETDLAEPVKTKKGKGKETGEKVGGKSSGNKSGKSGEKKSAAKGAGKLPKEKKIIEVRENTDPWINFSIFSKHVTHLQLFYRASSFKHCTSTSDIHTFVPRIYPFPLAEKSVKAGSNYVPKSPQAQQVPTILESTTKYKQRRPQDYFYVLVDTPTAKKLFITISVLCPNVAAEQDSFLTQTVAERQLLAPFSLNFTEYMRSYFSWTGVGRLNFTVVGTATRMLQLEDGLIGFLVVADLPANHFLQIASQSEFHVGTYTVCHDVSSRPSLSLTKYGSRVFNAFLKLKACELGSEEHAAALAEYHAAYLPESLTTFFSASRTVGKFAAGMRTKCEQVSVGWLYNRLRNDFEQFYSALKELQELMMTPDYGMEALSIIGPDFHEMALLRDEAMKRPLDDIIRESREQNAEEQLKEENGTGKGKKGKAKNKSNGSAKTDKKTKDKSKNDDKKGKPKEEKKKLSKSGTPLPSKKSNKEPPSHILFENKEISGNDLLSKIVEEQPEWLKYFPFRNDLELRTLQQDYIGTAPVSAYGDWFPIVRLIVNVSHQDRAFFNGIFFSSSAALSFLHVINNDTQTEMALFLTNIVKDWFKRNKYGYTIYAYGFCDNTKIKEHTWKVHLAAPYSHDLLKCCVGVDPVTGICVPPPPQALKVKHVYGHFIPNRRNTVLRCILTVACSQILTLRLTLSNPKARAKAKILHDMDENGDSELIYEKTFVGKITLPSLPFSVGEPNEDGNREPMVYLIDAELADADAWLLTEHELDLVETIKEKNMQDLMVFASVSTDTQQTVISDSGRRSSWSSKKRLARNEDIVPDSAYWCVQVIVDADLESKVTLEANDRKAKEIRRLKEAWEGGEPGRYMRAATERQKILEQRKEERRQLGLPISKSKVFQSFQLRESCISKEQRMLWKALAEDYGNEQQEKRSKEREEYNVKMKEITEMTAKFTSDQKNMSKNLNEYLLMKERTSMSLLETGYKLREAGLKKLMGNSDKKEKGSNDKKGGKAKAKGKGKKA